MTQTLGFGWTYSDATHYVITELFADGTSRTVDSQYALYQEWIQSNTPSQIAGNQYVTFPDGVPAFDAETQAANQLAEKWATIRAQRNAQLTATDWTQMSDSPLSDEDKKAMAEYRQTLRDIPQNSPDPVQIDMTADVALPESVILSKNLKKGGKITN